MKMTKQVVKIFSPSSIWNDELKERETVSLEFVINEFLKKNPDHKIILTDYCLMDIPEEHDTLEKALIVFEVSDSTSTGSGGKKPKPKPKPKTSPRKPRREPREATDWSGKSWQRDVYQGSKSPYGQRLEEPPKQRVRQ